MNRKRANKICHSKEKPNRLDVAFYLKAELGIVDKTMLITANIERTSCILPYTRYTKVSYLVLNILFASYVSGSLFNLLFNQHISAEQKNKWDLK